MTQASAEHGIYWRKAQFTQNNRAFMYRDVRYAGFCRSKKIGDVQDVLYAGFALLHGCNLVEQCRSNCRGAHACLSQYITRLCAA
jgi:hypothetical protein